MDDSKPVSFYSVHESQVSPLVRREEGQVEKQPIEGQIRGERGYQRFDKQRMLDISSGNMFAAFPKRASLISRF